MNQQEKSKLYAEFKAIAREGKSDFLARKVREFAKSQRQFIAYNGVASSYIRIQQKAFFDELVRRGDIVLNSDGEVVSMSLEVAYAQ